MDAIITNPRIDNIPFWQKVNIPFRQFAIMSDMDVILYFRPSISSKSEKLAGVREIAEKANVHVQVIDEAPTAERIRQLKAFWECLGIIVECGVRPLTVDPRVFGSTPVVFFNQSFNSLPKRCFAVRHDSRSTGLLAARELLLHDIPNFAYIPAPADPFWSQEREQGYADALALNGKGYIRHTWPQKISGATAKTKSLRAFVKDLPKPCAVFAANDAVAADVITAARMSGIAIPDDIAVLGVDNSTEICEHTNPTLSSIEPDFRRGGNLAMLMLLAIMRDGKSFRGSRQRIFGDLHVVRRLSTKRLQRADPIVAKALDLIRQKACCGLKAADVVRIFPCLRRMADLRFSQAVGHSILDEIQSVRLDRAKQLLLNPNQSLKTISDFCGFRHPNSLRKFFLKETGLTLSAWRKKHLNKPLPDDLPSL